jgi:hypothetical protein
MSTRRHNDRPETHCVYIETSLSAVSNNFLSTVHRYLVCSIRLQQLSEHCASLPRVLNTSSTTFWALYIATSYAQYVFNNFLSTVHRYPVCSIRLQQLSEHCTSLSRMLNTSSTTFWALYISTSYAQYILNNFLSTLHCYPLCSIRLQQLSEHCTSLSRMLNTSSTITSVLHNYITDKLSLQCYTITSVLHNYITDTLSHQCYTITSVLHNYITHFPHYIAWSDHWHVLLHSVFLFT